jgi:hypothetical protein
MRVVDLRIFGPLLFFIHFQRSAVSNKETTNKRARLI